MASGNVNTQSPSKKSSGKKARGGGVAGGMLDHMTGYDTRYPDLRSRRRLPGNGEPPPNPYGREDITPPYSYEKPTADNFDGPRALSKK